MGYRIFHPYTPILQNHGVREEKKKVLQYLLYLFKRDSHVMELNPHCIKVTASFIFVLHLHTQPTIFIMQILTYLLSICHSSAL